MSIHLSIGKAMLGALLMLLVIILPVHAQEIRIARIQPDVVSEGMTLAIEVLTFEKDSGAFGSDGIYLPFDKIRLQSPSDTEAVVFGPVVVSWNGRAMQIPVMIRERTAFDRLVLFTIRTGNRTSSQLSFRVKQPDAAITLVGETIFGDQQFGAGNLSDGNTLLVDRLELSSIDIQRARSTFSLLDPDTTLPGNTRYHPMTIISRGPVILKNVEISVSADSMNGGPGGGGGGGGFSHTGGAGYTGGGSNVGELGGIPVNIGAGTGPTDARGGYSTTEVAGGANDYDDQGGGGGTGSPFGVSGMGGAQNGPSEAGGYGAGSAGGEETNLPYGGGGGSFAVRGTDGAGIGMNSGHVTGGRFLVPMQGGSGGGAGNSHESPDSLAGSGGGGGGALTIIAFDTVMIDGALFSARGADGVSGKSIRNAGGGAGSGGGIFITSRKRFNVSRLLIDVLGGIGGTGSADIEFEGKGGNGGQGIVRIDGYIDTCKTCNFEGVQVSGPTIFSPSTPLTGQFGVVSGSAGGADYLTDSIRIYYRTRAEEWKFVDTIRFRDARGRYVWKKMLPLSNDAELFVTVMAKVAIPQRSFANYEPEYLVSHLSSAIIPVVPRPNLVLSRDTVDFGCLKILDSCRREKIYLFNHGGAPIQIESVMPTGAKFTIISSSDAIDPYSLDSIEVEFCPDQVMSYTGSITITSNDSSHVIFLKGCGDDKDVRIRFSTNPVNFGRVHVDSCVIRNVTVYSEGADSVRINPDAFNRMPFEIISPIGEIILSGKSGGRDTVVYTIRYCPKDTGEASEVFLFTDRRDSLVITGIGTMRKLTAPVEIDIGSLCLRSGCIDTTILIRNEGNDRVHVKQFVGPVEVLSPNEEIDISPYVSVLFTVRICPTGTGRDSIIVASDADEVLVIPIRYKQFSAAFDIEGSRTLGPLCIGECDSSVLQFMNSGSDSLEIVSAHLTSGTAIELSMVQTPTQLAPLSSLPFTLSYCPLKEETVLDTLVIATRSGGCDSVFLFSIEAISSDGGLVFSKKIVPFDEIAVGDCMQDSIIVTNVCGAPTQLTIPTLAAPFSVVSPTPGSATIGTNEQITIVYRYCPSSGAEDSALHELSETSGDLHQIQLSGKGIETAESFIHLRVEQKSVIEGELFTYAIIIDSISNNSDITSLSLSFRYDGALIAPIASPPTTSQLGWVVANGEEASPGVYRLSMSGSTPLTRGRLAEIQMLAFRSLRDTTSVVWDGISTVPVSQIMVADGSVNVIHCGDVPANLIIPGMYDIGFPMPNPASQNITVPVKIGADGILIASIADAAGSLAYRKLLYVKKGEQNLAFDVTLLPSGSYHLTLESWGWRDSRTVVVIK